MTKRSTASSSTETGAPAEPEDQVDLGRRSFFRTMGRSAVNAAGQVVGAADALRRGSAAAAEELLHIGVDAPTKTAERLASPTPPRTMQTPRSRRPTPLANVAGEAEGHRSPFRIDGHLLYLLDQRNLPNLIDEVIVREGRDLSRAIRTGVVRGGPLLGQLAAYGIALTAWRHRDRRGGAQRAEIGAAEGLLRGSRPSARPIVTALDRMGRRRLSLGTDVAADVLADALRSEADTIATEAMHDHAALARHGAAHLVRPQEPPFHLLLHGSVDALGNGMVGTGLALIQNLMADGWPLRIWVTSGAPTLEGARATSWELRQADVPHTVLPDTAVGWLMRRERVDAVVMGAEWLAANGDAAVLAGGAAIAALANTYPAAARPSVLLCAPLSCFDPGTLDGAAIPEDRRSRQEIPPELVATWGGTAPGQACDVVPAGLLDAIITEVDVLSSADPQTLPAALRTAHRARDDRRDPVVRMAG